MAIRNLLFDIDGTLVDTEEVFYDSLRRTLSAAGLEEALPAGLFGRSVPETFHLLGLEDRKDLMDRWDREFCRMSYEAPLYDGLGPVVRQLGESGCAMALVTSRRRMSAEPVLRMPEIAPFLLGCISEEDAVHTKPAPDPLFSALERFSMLREETAYVGDTLLDRQTAESAGCVFLAAGWNPAAAALGGRVLYRPDDLLKVVESR